MGSHRIGKVGPLFFISIVCLFGCNAFASFGLETPIEDGTPIFNSSAIIDGQPYYRYGHVEYEVYHSGEYSGALAAMPANHYVYAYQIFNNAASNLSIDAFIVSLVPGMTVANPADTGAGTGPSDYRNRSGSITYYFDDVILPDGHSSILLFSSLYGPGLGNGDVNGEGRNSSVEMIMVPVPEPVSFVLFGGGLLMLRSKRRSL